VSNGPFNAQPPRYLAYCHAQGTTPEAQRIADAKRYGSWTIAYVYWVRHEIVEWCKLNGRFRLEMDWNDHIAFSEWLSKKYPAPAREQYIRHRAAR
jgi:hypothetical protein